MNITDFFRKRREDAEETKTLTSDHHWTEALRRQPTSREIRRARERDANSASRRYYRARRREQCKADRAIEREAVALILAYEDQIGTTVIRHPESREAIAQYFRRDLDFSRGIRHIDMARALGLMGE